MKDLLRYGCYPSRQQTASGENGQNFGGYERKGGHSELVACVEE
ncbi:hypothetical protein [Mucilaginibacter gynuensis]